MKPIQSVIPERLVFAFCFILLASTANAYSNGSATLTNPKGVFGLEYAQAQINTLNESDLRRLNFYTGRAIEALADLADEDALAGQNGGALSGNTVAALRDAITRLIDAGRRSGLSQNDVADYFLLASDTRFAQNIPLALQGAGGSIDARALFDGITNRAELAANPQVDIDYLALLDAESAGLDLGIGANATTVQPGETVIIASGPQPRQGANSASIAIIERVVVDGETWRIEVVRGDNLAAYAAAIYGDSLSYRLIFNANTRVLINANTLEVGQVITLPKP